MLPAGPPDDLARDHTARDDSALCTSCGLCCDGLFTRVALAPADLTLAAEGGAAIVEHDGRPHAALPCTFLAGARCTVYDRRYAACRAFACTLLRRFRAGRVDWPTARDRVDRLRVLMEATRVEPDPADRRAVALAKVRRVAFELFADRHFRQGAAPAVTSNRGGEAGRPAAPG